MRSTKVSIVIAPSLLSEESCQWNGNGREHEEVGVSSKPPTSIGMALVLPDQRSLRTPAWVCHRRPATLGDQHGHRHRDAPRRVATGPPWLLPAPHDREECPDPWRLRSKHLRRESGREHLRRTGQTENVERRRPSCARGPTRLCFPRAITALSSRGCLCALRMCNSGELHVGAELRIAGDYFLEFCRRSA